MLISKTCKGSIAEIAKTYFATGRRLQIDVIRESIRQAKPDNHWEARVLGALNDELYIYQARITQEVITAHGCPSDDNNTLDKWVQDHSKSMEALDNLLDEIWHAPVQNASMLVLAGQRLRDLAG